MDPNELDPFSIIWPICGACIHDLGSSCVAYPNGIPFRLLSGLQDHRTVQPDQVGETVFEQDPECPPLDRSIWKEG